MNRFSSLLTRLWTSLFAAYLFFALPAPAQVITETGALPLVDSAVKAALVGQPPVDVLLEGTLTHEKGSQPIRILIKDRDKMRYEIGAEPDLVVTIFNSNRGWTIQGKRVRELPQHSSVRRPTLIPALDLISEVNNPALQTTNQGLKARGQQTAYHVSLVLPDTAEQRFLGRKLDETLEVFIDPATSLVVRTERLRRTQENMDLQIPSALDFGDYRLVDKTLYVPFHIVNTSGNSVVGMHQSTLIIARASINTGMSDSLFEPAKDMQ